jgi:hypothetical protein
MVLMNKAISGYALWQATGVPQSGISRLRSGKKRFEDLTVETLEKIQRWIDAGNYTFSYDYSELLDELTSDIEEGLTGEYLYVVRGDYNEIMEKRMIIDYYYTPEEIEEGDLAEKMLTDAVVEEMRKDSSIF